MLEPAEVDAAATERLVGVEDVEAALFEVEADGGAKAVGGNPCFNAVLMYGRRAWVPVMALRTGSEKSVRVAIAVKAAYKNYQIRSKGERGEGRTRRTN